MNLRLTYGIVSDLLNKDILYDLKNYFNVGNIIERKDEKSISYLVYTQNIFNYILPKLYGTLDTNNILKINNKGPIIKDFKIKKIIEIFNKYKLLNDNYDNNKQIINEILLLSYEVRDVTLKNKECLKDYLIRMKNKLNIN